MENIHIICFPPCQAGYPINFTDKMVAAYKYFAISLFFRLSLCEKLREA